jgi:uncharacterized MAPEG superfamily protein
MTPELTVLTLAALLWAVQFFAYLAVSHGKMDINKAMGPRDEPVEKPGTSGRMQRALSNHTEGLTLFAIAALVITVTNQSTQLTVTTAWIYLAMRVLYVPAYALGLTPWRTLIWMVGFFATVTILIAALLYPFFSSQILRGSPQDGGSAPTPTTTKDYENGKL